MQQNYNIPLEKSSHTNLYKISMLRNLSIWLGVIACFSSLQPWIVWPYPHIILILMCMFMMSRIIFFRDTISYAKLLSTFGIILFSFIYCQFFMNSFLASIYQIFYTLLPILVFLNFNTEENKIFLKRLINLFSIILLFSLITFLLHFFFDLPYVITKNNNDFYPPFKNFFTFVISENGDLGWFTRFSSIYTEPGHLSMTCAIFLFIMGYTWKKWQNILMTIALVWSLSLAGVILYFIGMILYFTAKSNNIPLTVFKIISCSLLIIILGISYYSPTNNDIISVKILSRLEFDESKGISGNNRNSIVFDQYYDNVTHSDKRYLGIGRHQMTEKYGGTGNSSYKNYILGNGYISFFGIIFLMSILLYSFPSKKGTGLMLLLCASFLQRPYFLWAIQVMPYIAALSCWCRLSHDKAKYRQNQKLFSTYKI